MKKRKFDLFELLSEMQMNIEDKTSKLYCQKCGSMLPVFRMIFKAKRVRHGETFRIKCRMCKYVNEVKKEYKKGQCFRCGRNIDGSKGNICCKCFKKEKRISEK